MIDRNLKPWVIELNCSPSLATDSPLDHSIKLALIKATLSMLNLSSKDKRKYKTLVSDESKRRLYGVGTGESKDMSKFKEKISLRMQKREQVNKM